MSWILQLEDRRILRVETPAASGAARRAREGPQGGTAAAHAPAD